MRRDITIYSAEFETGKVLLKETLTGLDLFVVRNGSYEYRSVCADRDQWGVFITLVDSAGENLTIGQEDGTRSFLDAMIKCLTEMRRLAEVESKDATIIGLGENYGN